MSPGMVGVYGRCPDGQVKAARKLKEIRSMGNSFREQLLKLGLVEKKQVDQVKKQE